ncbi:MAG: hypothetical protein CFH26_00473 [Alphaproteobacteria bacterium MarineAlpha6_Bin4]|nr:MAG: hypothetical protein CFH25_00074 [Alphaproteobacteria bacterium MarineAlpha6_Bin3]PPR37916.1 MAG: hypothetical protein CFH26_00473 [Alphaproteobacteria bacterium MarineAlpha6_Bin4]|tara:strand:- start:11340 stop:11699 length:360 start_codon:yes stop_codon:yes gene_type:complete
MKNFFLQIYSYLNGEFIGKDQLGNKYYKSNISHGTKKDKRWVLYKKNEDPTNIDPSWHAWLHHIIDKVPDKKKEYYWQKKITPNLTGSNNAYLPEGHSLNKKKKQQKKNYEPWVPHKKK